MNLTVLLELSDSLYSLEFAMYTIHRTRELELLTTPNAFSVGQCPIQF
jgi:hypothetical protein